MALADDLDRIAAAAAARAEAGETVAAVLAAEPAVGARTYVCAFDGADSGRTWLALDDDGGTVTDRRALLDAVSIIALCEIAAESAAGGDLDELHAQLVSLRVVEQPDGIEEAEAAVLALQRELGSPPQLATPARLDAIGVATRRLELALDPLAGSPFASAMRAAQDAVDALARDIEAGYRVELVE
ncbi:MAG TPA: hypothetical protein VH950_07675 [Gaiellaceae bacterium]|jgi:hypothetical protein